MTTPAHPQRCETCENFCDWKGAHSDIGETVHEIMGKYGCASHSSVQSRDQVLDYLIEFCESRMDGYIVTVETMEDAQYQFQKIGRILDELGVIKRKCEELRTQGSRDP